jgi:hypothetical protein
MVGIGRGGPRHKGDALALEADGRKDVDGFVQVWVAGGPRDAASRGTSARTPGRGTGATSVRPAETDPGAVSNAGCMLTPAGGKQAVEELDELSRDIERASTGHQRGASGRAGRILW